MWRIIRAETAKKWARFCQLTWLYEQTPKGEYVQLAPFWTRASYLGDLSRRRLLTPDKRQTLDFQAIRLMSRQLQPGSRVVMVLSVIKDSGRQINYGTGKEVSDETIQDAKSPLEIRWFNDSYIEVPVRRWAGRLAIVKSASFKSPTMDATRNATDDPERDHQSRPLQSRRNFTQGCRRQPCCR
jgi:hypothetical protein